MRADRLIHLLLVLQSRPQVTAAEVAAELEVSIPTARRDLDALSAAGIPVYPVRGRGGGWRLLDGARTNLTGLTEPEVTALFALLGNVRTAPGDATRAIAKLLQAVPGTFRSGAGRVAAATIMGASWGRPETGAAPDSVAILQRAIATERRVLFTYRDKPPRELVPLIVASKGDYWYLVAAPVTEGEDTADPARMRVYRVDRIRDPTLTRDRGHAFERFDPAAVWGAMVQRIEGLRGGVHAELVVDAPAVQPLLTVFGVHATLIREQPDGRSRVTVRAHTVTGLAQQLAGWTGVAEVHAPVEVRDALAALGQTIMETYRR